HDRVDAVMPDVPVGADARSQEPRGRQRPYARVPCARNGAVPLDGAADQSEQGVQSRDGRLVERMENTVAERGAVVGVVAPTVGGSLCGELLPPDRRLTDRKDRGRNWLLDGIRGLASEA